MSLGFVVALVVLLVALGAALGLFSAAHLIWWLIAGLALAILLGGVAVPFRTGPAA